MKIIHRRDAEFTEKNFGIRISEFEFPTLRPQRLRGESSECFVIFVLLSKIYAPRANLMTTENISDSEIPPAKARRALRSDNYFLCGLCVFAGDIPNSSVAALSRYVVTMLEG